MGIFDLFKSSKESGEVSEGSRLFLIAKGGVDVLETAYLRLSDKGKFEAILFNSVSILGLFKNRYPQRYSAAENDYFKALAKQCNEY
jgi:hypothetical protein